MTKFGKHIKHDAKGLAATSAGAGLKHEHAGDIVAGDVAAEFFEIHAENYMGDGGPPHALLRQIRSERPISIHGVGLSIGSARPLDRRHLARLKTLIGRYQPALFSEHLAWSTHDDMFLNDLLPIPYNRETLAHISTHINEVQDTLGMRMLLENPATYVSFETSTMSETEYLGAIAERTGCGLLLDVNNVFISAINNGFDSMRYINEFPFVHVGEIHLAGHAEDKDADGERLLIDSHGTIVADAVWTLYRHALKRIGPIPTLIEWDNDVPPFPILAGEVARAKAELSRAAEPNVRPIAA